MISSLVMFSVCRLGGPASSASSTANLLATGSRPLTTNVRLEDGMLELQVGRNSGPAEWFELDSGSPSSYLYSGLDGSTKPPDAPPITLTLGRTVLATITPESDDAPADAGDGRVGGLLGADFLRQVVLAVDSTSGKAAVWPSASFAEPSLAKWLDARTPGKQGSISVPLSVDEDGLPLIPDFQCGRVAQPVLFDTGTSYCLLPKKTLEQVAHYALVPMSLDGWDKVEDADAYMIPSLSVGSWVAGFPMVLTLVGDKDDAILGENVLGSLIWALDLSGRKLWLRSPGRAADGSDFDLPGRATLHVADQAWNLKLPRGYDLPAGVYPVVHFGELNVAEVTGPTPVRDPSEADAAYETRQLNCYGERTRRFLVAFQQVGEADHLDVWVTYRGKETKVSLRSSDQG